MLLTTLTAALACAGLSSASPLEHEARQGATGLNTAFVARGRSYIGTSLTIRSDTSESNIIKAKGDFGCITPENAMKWDATEPSRGQFSYSGADAVVSFATQNNKQLRCHTLVWYSQLPSWVSNGNFNNATLITIMTNHINTLMKRWAGKCTYWDVVNEALNEDGTYRDNVFLKTIGEAYIPMAFRIAAAADPAAKLFYNDYNLEYGTEKHAGAMKIVKLVQAYGVKIDGVGFQGHLVSEPTSTQNISCPSTATLTSSLQRIADLGVDVAYTELDIRMNTPATSAKLAAQADAWGRVAASCLAVSRCIGMTIWGVSDTHSWVPSTFSGEGAALLWDNSYAKKPAYDAFLKAIQSSPAPTATAAASS